MPLTTRNTYHLFFNVWMNSSQSGAATTFGRQYILSCMKPTVPILYSFTRNKSGGDAPHSFYLPGARDRIAVSGGESEEI
eukprot:4842620-Pleurochrysis_carterae.AAC.1